MALGYIERPYARGSGQYDQLAEELKAREDNAKAAEPTSDRAALLFVPNAPHLSFCVVDRLKQPFEARRMIDRPGAAEANTKQLQIVRCEQTDGYDLTGV